MKDLTAAVNARCGDLDLFLCEECGFVFNREFELAKLEYGDDYDNAQYFSPSFSAHIDSLVNHMVLDRDVRGCRVVEVGCGQGLFLRKLVEYHGSGNTGWGFDPSYNGPVSTLDGRLQFQKRYYTEESTDVVADVVVARHVIEHVPDPRRLLENIGKALVNAKSARIFCETPCVEWIFKNRVIWDFFYEHCSYFSSSSLTTAFQLAGFQVEQVRHVFGGQYLLLEAVTTAGRKPEVIKNPGLVVSLGKEFAQVELQLIELWKKRIKDLAANETIALWGAGAKGVTFANLIEPRRKLIDCIVDLNPQKQGRFIPGSGHPIVSPPELAKRGVTTAILMNPNYKDENLALLRKANLNVRLIDHL